MNLEFDRNYDDDISLNYVMGAYLQLMILPIVSKFKIIYDSFDV